MPKWIVTRTDETEYGIEASTGPQAIAAAMRVRDAEDPGAKGHFSAVTENGEQPCEGCGKPATTADIEGVPLCKACFDDMLNEPDTSGEDSLGGSWV